MAFPSVYEMFVEDLTTVRKQHFWEYFSGATLNSRWTTASGSVAIQDVVGGGMRQTTGSSIYDKASITFGSVRQFSPTANVFITVCKADNDNSSTNVGLGNATSGDLRNVSNDNVSVDITSTNTYIRLSSVLSGSSSNLTDSTIPVDAEWHTHKIISTSSDLKLYVDGVLNTTKTSDRPALKLMPSTFTLTLNGSTATTDVRYMECYNT